MSAEKLSHTAGPGEMFLLRGLANSYRSDIAVEREIGYGSRISRPMYEIIRDNLQ